MKSKLVAILLAVFWAVNVLGEIPMGEFSMEDTSTEELDMEMDSFGLDVTYGWSGDIECFHNVLEEESKKIPALKELWEHKKEQAEHLLNRFKGCKRKHKWERPLCFAEVSAKMGIFLVEFYAKLNEVVDDATFHLIKDLINKCLN